MAKKTKKVHYDMSSNITDLNDPNHPLRVMAKRIIEEVVVFYLPIEDEFGRDRDRIENDIVALLSNLD